VERPASETDACVEDSSLCVGGIAGDAQVEVVAVRVGGAEVEGALEQEWVTVEDEFDVAGPWSGNGSDCGPRAFDSAERAGGGIDGREVVALGGV
jgi:hypothetical protein